MGNPHKIKKRDYLQVIGGAAFPVLLIFSTVTLTAPSVELGVGILIFTMILAFLSLMGIFRTQNKVTIMKHLVIGFAIAFGVSVVFLYLWTGTPFEEILTWNFFVTEALIATCVGGFTGSVADATRG